MSTLVESSNSLIDGFSSYSLYALELRAQLAQQQQRGEGGDNNNNNNNNAAAGLGRSTMTENYTSHTNISDGSSSNAYGSSTLDPNDLQRIDADVESSKNYLTQVKLAWLESNVKTRYVMRLLGMMENPQEQGPVMQSDNEALEEKRILKKSELKKVKNEAEQIKSQIKETAKMLDEDLTHHVSPAMEEARLLTRQIQDMELELAMLRNSRPEEQRMTIDEATQALDDQIDALQSIATSQESARAGIQVQKQALLQKQKENERLSAERTHYEKLEKEARNAVRNKDRRIEENCRTLGDRAGLLAAVLGIKAVEPHPNGELRIVYSLEQAGRTATLAIYSDVSKRHITGAKLLDSNVEIDDIVQRCLANNDLQEMVLEVLVRIS